VAGVVLAAVGVAGLARGATPQHSAGATPSVSDPIVVTNAYVHPPLPPSSEAAAYFTVYDTTGTPDVLESVSTGAGGQAVLHTVVGGVMTAVTGGVTIPAHGSLVLSVGTGHVMISDLFGPLKPGQIVDMELEFQNAGPVEVIAPVIAYGAPVPGQSSGGSK
jgi:copper(I)-binding protein